MLIEALAKLASDSGAQRISLEIPPSDGGNCSVMVMTSFGQDHSTANDEQHARVLAVLAQPLVVEGHVGELDGKIVRLIDEIESDLVAAAKALPETDANKRARELRESTKEKSSAPEGPKAGDKTDGDSDTETDQGEALASGEAESL